jgi:hypothetical protein
MQKAQGYSKLFASWAELTQKNGIAAAADHSRIRELDRGILLVEADHPGWIQILQTRESRLLEDFRRRFPDLGISGISLMLSRGGQGAGGAEDGPEQPEANAAPLPEAPAPEEKAGYAAIKDTAFRDSLKRLGQSIATKEGTRITRNSEMLSNINAQNIHEEVKAAGPVGKEVW